MSSLININNNLNKIKLGTLIISSINGIIFKNKNDPQMIIKCSKKESHWKNEKDNLSILKHNNIIKLKGQLYKNIPLSELMDGYNINKSKERYWVLCQEYAKKGDLLDLINQYESFDEDISRAFIFPIIHALNYAYDEHNISHRDVKLDNIFIMDDWTVKLGDWGLSINNVKNNKCIKQCGTRNYASPQILKNTSYDPNKNDVWSAGIVLFSLVTGTQPFCIKLNNDWEKDIYVSLIKNKNWNLFWLKKKYSFVSQNEISVDFKNLIEHMLDFNENTRYNLNQVLNHKWIKKDINSAKILKDYFE